MFKVFSSGYYFGRLYVEPHAGERAVMQRAQHERVNEQVYADEEAAVERLDYPLVMKLGSTHFPVYGDGDVPAGTLALPERLLEGTRVDNPPTLHEVLLARKDRAAQMLDIHTEPA